MVTGPLKRSVTSVGGVSTRDCVTGEELGEVDVREGRSGHDECDGRDPEHGPPRSRPETEASEDGSRVAIREQEDGEQHEGERETGAPPSWRGRSAWHNGKSETTTSIQPIAWWRNAAREYSHGFGSCTRKATPETKRAAPGTSDQRGLTSFPRTRASSTAPATSAACAQTACARRCIVENVEKTVMIHRPTLETTTTIGNGMRARPGAGRPRARRSPRR